MTKQPTEDKTAAKVLELTKELLETKRKKKVSAAVFNDEVKRIEKEIAALITGEEVEVIDVEEVVEDAD